MGMLEEPLVGIGAVSAFSRPSYDLTHLIKMYHLML